MPEPKRGFLDSVRRLRGRLAIGQILREEYVYEVHGPFVAVAPPPEQPATSPASRFSASLAGLIDWSPLRRRAAR